MPGVFDPSPRRSGGQAGRPTEVILQALLEAGGTGLTDAVPSAQWAEALAEARAINYLWELNRRMANQWDPARMTDFLPRWERILGLVPLPTDTDAARRAKVAAKDAVYGEPPSRQVVSDLMAAVLGPVFVGLVYTPSTIALGHVAGGATVPGGVTLTDGDWYSTIAHLLVLVQQPAGMPDVDFYATVGQVRPFLDDLLPSWVTFDWARDGTGGDGFFLDDAFNIDNERFDA